MGQDSDNLSFETEAFILGVVFVAFLLHKYQTEIQNFKNYFLSLWPGTIVFLIVVLVYLVIFALTHISIKSGKFIFNKAKKKQEEAIMIKKEIIEIEKILETDLPLDEKVLTNEIERLRDKINICNEYEPLQHFRSELKKRLAKATELLGEVRKKHITEYLDEKIRQKQDKIENLDKEIRAKEEHEKNKNKMILWELKAEENPVFLKDNLSEKEINALIEDGYCSVCEYCMIQNKFINVLVKPQLNHSPTHAFLVWNVRKLLEKINGIKNIKEYLTKEADIIFNYNGKNFAIEIETGNLLGKKKQLQEKLNYLNKKYPLRWMFIVSNRNLLSEYNKFGIATQRKGVSEKIAKMLEITHPI